MCAVRLPLPLPTTGSTYPFVLLDASTAYTHKHIQANAERGYEMQQLHAIRKRADGNRRPQSIGSCVFLSFSTVLIHTHVHRFICCSGRLNVEFAIFESTLFNCKSKVCRFRLRRMRLRCGFCIELDPNRTQLSARWKWTATRNEMKRHSPFSNSALNWTLPLSVAFSFNAHTHRQARSGTHAHRQWLCAFLELVAKPFFLSFSVAITHFVFYVDVVIVVVRTSYVVRMFVCVSCSLRSFGFCFCSFLCLCLSFVAFHCPGQLTGITHWSHLGVLLRLCCMQVQRATYIIIIIM